MSPKTSDCYHLLFTVCSYRHHWLKENWSVLTDHWYSFFPVWVCAAVLDPQRVCDLQRSRRPLSLEKCKQCWVCSSGSWRIIWTVNETKVGETKDNLRKCVAGFGVQALRGSSYWPNSLSSENSGGHVILPRCGGWGTLVALSPHALQRLRGNPAASPPTLNVVRLSSLLPWRQQSSGALNESVWIFSSTLTQADVDGCNVATARVVTILEFLTHHWSPREYYIYRNTAVPQEKWEACFFKIRTATIQTTTSVTMWPIL